MPADASFQQLSYQVCPIILNGGTAAQIPGGMLPLIALFAQGPSLNVMGLPDLNDLDDAFGAFNVLPGGTLVTQSIGKYPFANQWVAANAVIREPLTVSVIMDAPMRGENAWEIKQSVFTTMKATLDQHNNKGGTYTIATPAFIYTNMVMISVTDNSRGNNSLPQNAWRFDFERPLVVLQELQEAQNQLMNMISNGVPPTTPNVSGPQVGTTGPQANQAQTYKVAAGLVVGPGNPLRSLPGQGIRNYPALPPPGNFPYQGIS